MSAHQDKKHPQHCSQVRKVWSPSRWRRGRPKGHTVEALRSCPNWRRARSRYYAHRRKMLWRERVTPFFYSGHWWAAPWPIAICESGGNYEASSAGAYGLIAPGWTTGGGLEFAPYAAAATDRQQDIVAHRLYSRYGEGPWAPFESGCYLR